MRELKRPILEAILKKVSERRHKLTVFISMLLV